MSIISTNNELKIEMTTIYCTHFLDNSKTEFIGCKCDNPSIKGDARYCPYINNDFVSCPIIEEILRMKCCSHCGYHERFIGNYGFKHTENRIFICSNCERELNKDEIIRYRKLIQKKSLMRLRRAWFCGNNKTGV